MIISSISYKGGVGKSTVAQNLAVCLAANGYKTCIVDADETQATISWTGIRFEKSIEPEIQAIGMSDSKALIGNVKAHYKNYDVIIIDCPPSLSPVAVKAMYLSHLLLIPITPRGGSDIWVTEKLLDKFDTIREEKDGKLPAYFVINQFEPKINLHKASLAIIKELEKEFGINTLKSVLNKRVAYGEANVRGLGAYEYSDPKAKKEVIAMAKEVLKIGEKI